jgi:hypothetical protein
MRPAHLSRTTLCRLTAAGALAVAVAAPMPSAFAASSITTVLTLSSTATTGLPAIVAPGYHTFTIKETAKQLKKDPRGITVLQLAKGYTTKQFRKDSAATFAAKADLKAYARLTKSVVSLGGLAPEVGYTTTAASFSVLLKAGSYLIDNGAADVGAPDKFTAFMVSGTAVGAKPKTVGTVTSKEYGYKLVGVKHGKHLYALHNAGAQIHMYVIFRLDKGHTEKDLFTALQAADAPQPAWVHNGGFAGVITGGQTMYTTLNFSASSNYELICFMPDLKTGAPHFALGMHRFFSVK